MRPAHCLGAVASLRWSASGVSRRALPEDSLAYRTQHQSRRALSNLRLGLSKDFVLRRGKGNDGKAALADERRIAEERVCFYVRQGNRAA